MKKMQTFSYSSIVVLLSEGICIRIYLYMVLLVDLLLILYAFWDFSCEDMIAPRPPSQMIS